jgi:polar amino acid transport system substrate-binding protein
MLHSSRKKCCVKRPSSQIAQVRSVGVWALGLVMFGQAMLAAAATAQIAAKKTSAVQVPSFWDPMAHVEKPDLGSLRVIRFLTDDDYPPFDFIAPDGSLAGFNVDLARAICDELKVACTVQPRRWDTLIEALDAGRGDAAIASLAITEAARRKVDFTLPYYRTPARFATRKDSPLTDATPEALAGKTIGVEKGTAHAAFLETFFPRATIKTYDNATALHAGLSGGAIDALFGDGVTLAVWLNGSDAADCCVFKGGPFTESRYFGDGVGIAVKKNNLALRRALDYALQRLSQRGVYAEIYLKYFPVGFF